MSEQRYRSELDLVYQDDAEVAACRSTPTAHRDVNAEFIAHACNAYGPLVAALKDIANGEGAYGWQAHEYKTIARQALKDIGEDTE